MLRLSLSFLSPDFSQSMQRCYILLAQCFERCCYTTEGASNTFQGRRSYYTLSANLTYTMHCTRVPRTHRRSLGMWWRKLFSSFHALCYKSYSSANRALKFRSNRDLFRVGVWLMLTFNIVSSTVRSLLPCLQSSPTRRSLLEHRWWSDHTKERHTSAPVTHFPEGGSAAPALGENGFVSMRSGIRAVASTLTRPQSNRSRACCTFRASRRRARHAVPPGPATRPEGQRLAPRSAHGSLDNSTGGVP